MPTPEHHLTPFDVAIIGAGPAGGMAANTLAGHDLRVVVLESQTLPRHKACGGLMPGKVASWFDWDISSLVAHRVAQLHIERDDERLSTESRQHPLLLVDRSRFDHGLMAWAGQRDQKNLQIIEGFRVEQLVERPGRVALTSDRGVAIEARYVIAADGANSQVARLLGLARGARPAAAIDVELQLPADAWHQLSDALVFDYSYLPGGYAWVFPKSKPRVSCGIGSWNRSAGLRQRLAAFTQQRFRGASEVRHMGYPIPVYAGQERLGTGRVMLAGDAAGLVDPVLGEGIRYALLSGRAAGRAILAEGIGRPERVVGHYRSEIARAVAPTLEYLQRFVALPYLQAPDTYLRLAAGKASAYADGIADSG